MKLWARHLILAVAAMVAVWLIGSAFTGRAAAQGAAATRPPAGQFFKNVSTSTLKVLSVDDFMGAMGVMAAALGFDCSDCHPGAGSDTVDWVIDTPKKVTARKMTEMVAVINKTNFGGAQVVTCWTCHHGREVPATTIALDHLYGSPNDEKDDVIAKDPGAPPATQILDKYIAALGGAQKLGALKSFIATGTSVGYEKLGGGGTFQILAKFPDQHSTSIVFKDRPERGDSTRVYDGKTGWIKTPRALLKRYELSGGELDGARFDALLCFPSQIKTALTNLRVGFTDSINDKDVDVVQGTGPRGLLVTLYFDKKTNLLVRYVRMARSPIGHVPVQVDYADYRDVGGIKFPFQYTFSWLDGRDAFQLTDVKVNAPIQASQFGAPPE
jgi:photosynthetic reaction center cytochrome c subunit